MLKCNKQCQIYCTIYNKCCTKIAINIMINPVHRDRGKNRTANVSTFISNIYNWDNLKGENISASLLKLTSMFSMSQHWPQTLWPMLVCWMVRGGDISLMRKTNLKRKFILKNIGLPDDSCHIPAGPWLCQSTGPLIYWKKL